MKNIITSFFCIFIISNLLSQQFDYQKDETNELLNFQKYIIENKQAASNVVLVYKGGKRVYYHAENSNKNGDKQITEDTIFPIWSMTKPITTVAIMILYERGLIDLDDPVSKYIPSYSNLNCKGKDGLYKCKNQVKLVHLMAHTSGFLYYSTFMQDAYKSESLEELIDKVALRPLEFEPGTDYAYGLNQDILGRVVEVASGKSFSQFMEDEIFIPLEMKNTKFYLSVEERNLFQSLYINNGNIEGFSDLGITGLNDFITYEIENKAHMGSQGLVSTISDFSKFCEMLVNNGVYKNQRIITLESIKTMTSKYADGPHAGDIDFPGVYNGLGFYVLENPKLMDFNAVQGIYGHGGYMSTEFFIDPKNSLYAVFLTRALTRYNHRFHFMKAVYDVF